jgi:hypothetical protein
MVKGSALLNGMRFGSALVFTCIAIVLVTYAVIVFNLRSDPESDIPRWFFALLVGSPIALAASFILPASVLAQPPASPWWWRGAAACAVIDALFLVWLFAVGVITGQFWPQLVAVSGAAAVLGFCVFWNRGEVGASHA